MDVTAAACTAITKHNTREVMVTDHVPHPARMMRRQMLLPSLLNHKKARKAMQPKINKVPSSNTYRLIFPSLFHVDGSR